MQTLNNEQPNSFFGFVGLKTTNLYTLFLCANHCQIFFFFVVYLLKDNNKNLFKQQLTYGIVPQFNYVTWYSWTRDEFHFLRFIFGSFKIYSHFNVFLLILNHLKPNMTTETVVSFRWWCTKPQLVAHVWPYQWLEASKCWTNSLIDLSGPHWRQLLLR